MRKIRLINCNPTLTSNLAPRLCSGKRFYLRNCKKWVQVGDFNFVYSTRSNHFDSLLSWKWNPIWSLLLTTFSKLKILQNLKPKDFLAKIILITYYVILNFERPKAVTESFEIPVKWIRFKLKEKSNWHWKANHRLVLRNEKVLSIKWLTYFTFTGFPFSADKSLNRALKW